MAIRLLGDQEIAGRYVGYAKHLLTRIKELLNISGLNRWSERRNLDEAKITVLVCYKTELITIVGISGAGFYFGLRTHKNNESPYYDSTTKWTIEQRSFQDGHLISGSTFGSTTEVWPTYYYTRLPYAIYPFVYIVDECSQGFSSITTVSWRIQKRKLNGDSVWDQILPGYFAANVSSTIVADKDNIYAGGWVSQNTYDITGRIECRDGKTGLVLWHSENPGTDYKWLNLSNDRVYAGVYTQTVVYPYQAIWQVESWDKSGNLVWTQQYIGANYGGAVSRISNDADGVYVGGFKIDLDDNFNHLSRVERRDIDTGDLVWEWLEDNPHPGFVFSNIVTGLIAGKNTLYVSTHISSVDLANDSYKLVALNKETKAVIWQVDIG
jgi:hypothetical protein